jgi:UDP-GlcNAc:undecaprenyl-phosphate/decaprenyl-phosphate GlcNAc-1-phosphate transferase
MVYLLVALVSLVTAMVATPLARRLSFRLNIVAEPGGRRHHEGRIPKLGGLAVFIAWLAGVILIYWLLPPDNPDDAIRLRGVVLGSLIVVIGGLLDDRYELKPSWQFLIQFLGAAIAIGHIIFIEVFTNPFAGNGVWTATPLFDVEGDLVWIWRPLAYLFTVFWVMGMINAVNFLDGLDGLAAGVCLIAAGFFAWHSYQLGQLTVPLFPLALAGALLGFLPFNFSPARVFLGSAGAYFLGYQMATLSILSPAKLSTALLVLAVPIVDVAWQIISRLRRGQHPFQGDRGHLHFRLADSGLPTRRIVLGYYVVAILFGLVAVLVASPVLKIVMLGALAVGVVALLLRLDLGATKNK